MMVKLRLKRIGKKKVAFYRIVATDARMKRDGEYIELIGTYNPINGDIKIDQDLAYKWLSTGAKPTDTVRNLLSKEGLMTKLHNEKHVAKPTKSTKAKTTKPAKK
ncbi:30S ribosomal protein S16 [Spiroplasma endosymbiont of Polydrusus cervinus]|uniref:30S ribosomal protein S16 n=1 Tax=Spiroplasma endosymbiont of Polydrusus cervinus TaxID=3066287 RepID=UPI003BB21231